MIKLSDWWDSTDTAPSVKYVSGLHRLVVGGLVIVLFVTLFAALIGVWRVVEPATAADTPTAAVDTATAAAETATAAAAMAQTGVDAATAASDTTTEGAGAAQAEVDAANAAAETAKAAAGTASAAAETASATAAATDRKAFPVLFGFWRPEVSGDEALFVLVLIASLIGGVVYVGGSVAKHASERTMTVSYLWWYPLRLLVGAGLALLLYTALRGGLFSGDFTTEKINPYGVAALAGLTGMFSKQATAKLAQLFDVAFSVTPSKRAPKIDALVPAETAAGSEDTAIRVSGSGFVGGATATANETPVDVSDVSAGGLSIMLPKELLATVRVIKVRVDNPDPTVGASAPAEFKVV